MKLTLYLGQYRPLKKDETLDKTTHHYAIHQQGDAGWTTANMAWEYFKVYITGFLSNPLGKVEIVNGFLDSQQYPSRWDTIKPLPQKKLEELLSFSPVMKERYSHLFSKE